MRNTIVLLVAIVLCVAGCGGDATQDRPHTSESGSDSTVAPTEPQATSHGAPATKPGRDARRDRADSVTWTLRSPDGSRYAAIDWGENELRIDGDTLELRYLTDSSPDLKRHDFQPQAFDPAYTVMHFAVDSVGADDYYVLVNDEGKTRLLSKEHPQMSFETWSEHVPGTLVVLDTSVTVRAQPSDTAAVVSRSSDEILQCADQIEVIDGAWAKIRCHPGCTGDPDLSGTSVGWIRWHQDGKRTISLRYAC